MDQNFQPEIIHELELTALLHELHEPDSWRDRFQESASSDELTVAAVAEATGLPVEYVQKTLDDLRESDHITRLTHAVNQSEEPLYSVERPGHASRDPLDAYYRNTLFKSSSHDENRLKKSKLFYKNLKRKEALKVTIKDEFITSSILISLLLMFIGVVLVAIARIFMMR